MPLQSEKMLEIIPIFLHLLRLVLCPSMCLVRETVPPVLEKNVYSGFFFRYNVMNIAIKSHCCMASFRISVALPTLWKIGPLVSAGC